MIVADLLVLLAKQHPDATVYVENPVSHDVVPVTGLEPHNRSVVLTTGD